MFRICAVAESRLPCFCSESVTCTLLSNSLWFQGARRFGNEQHVQPDMLLIVRLCGE